MFQYKKKHLKKITRPLTLQMFESDLDNRVEKI